ncbi:MAG: arsenical-resistance protein, partial [Cyanobacteriota bacterium]|nr:arsenical-resistance protein [Cyanobacteriota bacterium]
MGLFERYLSVWIGLAIVAGVGLGAWFPDSAASIAALEAAGIN